MSKLSIIIIFFLVNSTLDAQIYVKINGTGDGTSWANAFGNLNAALNSANSGHTIWVARGTYYPTQCNNCSPEDRDMAFEIPDGVVVLGGFLGTETTENQRDWENNTTTLSGDINQDGTIAHNSYTVVVTNNVGAATTLDGFLITDGNANGEEGSLEIKRQSGAGWFNGSIANSISNPTVRNCTFNRNEAKAFGGAMYNFGSFDGNSSPTYINCTFIHNKTGFDGGAVYNNGSFNGISKSTFIQCHFKNNLAGRVIGSGGAIYNNGIQGEASPNISACVFSTNHGTLYGGAMYNQGKSGKSSPKITNSVFYKNSAYEGGAIYNLGAESGRSNPTIRNCTFHDNYAENGAALLNNGYVDGTSNPEISNCIIWGNRALVGAVFYNIYGTPFIEYSLVDAKDCVDLNQHFENDFSIVNCGEGMLYDGAKPQFVKPSTGDLHLKFNSKAINVGNNNLVTDEPLDIEQKTRISLGKVDLGAYEYDGPLSTKMDSLLVENKEEYIHISWKTLNEYQNAGFQLQRSLDDSTYETLTFIESTGDSDSPQAYEYQDSDIVPGAIHAYRLQRLDLDGCSEFSEVDTTYIEIIETSVIVSPNPAAWTTNLTLSLEEESEIVIELVNIYGQREMIVNEMLPRGQRIIPIDVRDKPDGIYTIWMRMRNQRFSYPFVVARL